MLVARTETSLEYLARGASIGPLASPKEPFPFVSSKGERMIKRSVARYRAGVYRRQQRARLVRCDSISRSHVRHILHRKDILRFVRHFACRRMNFSHHQLQLIRSLRKRMHRFLQRIETADPNNDVRQTTYNPKRARVTTTTSRRTSIPQASSGLGSDDRQQDNIILLTLILIHRGNRRTTSISPLH